jgi:hypothetical protein
LQIKDAVEEPLKWFCLFVSFFFFNIDYIKDLFCMKLSEIRNMVSDLYNLSHCIPGTLSSIQTILPSASFTVFCLVFQTIAYNSGLYSLFFSIFLIITSNPWLQPSSHAQFPNLQLYSISQGRTNAEQIALSISV